MQNHQFTNRSVLIKRLLLIGGTLLFVLSGVYLVQGNRSSRVLKTIASDGAIHGAKLVLLVDTEAYFPSSLNQDSWTVVQWQTNDGRWIDVDGWQGNFHYDQSVKAFFVEWWVGREILGQGPFRWVIYTDSSRSQWITTTDSFNLPEQSGKIMTIYPTFAKPVVKSTAVPQIKKETKQTTSIEPTQEASSISGSGVLAIAADQAESLPSGPQSLYVSRLGNNGDGLSWATAWNEMDQIDWEMVTPGSTIFLDGGRSRFAPMIYRTTLRPANSGTADETITLQLSAETGRDGQAILFGGNSVPLPECGQLDWNDTELLNAGEAAIIFADGVSNLTIDGRKRGGITIHGWGQNGIIFDPDRIDNGEDDNTANITLQYLEIYNNGGVEKVSDGSVQDLYLPDHAGAGIRLSGVGHTFSFLEIHDNAADAIQSSFTDPANGVFNNIDAFTLSNSWLYNQRAHSGNDNSPEGEVCSLTNPSECDELGAPQKAIDYFSYPETFNDRREAFNWCTHNDGIQIFSGNDLNEMTITDSIIGPNLMTALLLGDRGDEGTTSAWVNDLTMEDVVLTRFTHSALGMKNPPQQAGENWSLNRVTIYGHYNNVNKDSLQIDSTADSPEHNISNSSMVFGRTKFANGNIDFSNNCEFMLYSGSIGGVAEDPLFANIISEDVFENDLTVDFKEVFLDDYTPINPKCLTATSETSSVGTLISTFNVD